MCKSQLKLIDGVLYYQWEDPILKLLELVAPKQMHNQILEHCHDIRLSGHLGYFKTVEKLRRIAIWHGMSQDCKIYIQPYVIKTRNQQKKQEPH